MDKKSEDMENKATEIEDLNIEDLDIEDLENEPCGEEIWPCQRICNPRYGCRPGYRCDYNCSPNNNASCYPTCTPNPNNAPCYPSCRPNNCRPTYHCYPYYHS